MNGEDKFEIEVNGNKVTAAKEQTIAEVLLTSGLRVLRTTRNQSARGVYCGMGLCYECRMIVNGVPNVRTCVTPATPGCKVETQDDARIEQSI